MSDGEDRRMVWAGAGKWVLETVEQARYRRALLAEPRLELERLRTQVKDLREANRGLVEESNRYFKLWRAAKRRNAKHATLRNVVSNWLDGSRER